MLVVSARMFNTDRGAGAGSADLLGGLLATVSLSLGVLAIVRIAEVGWTSAQTLVTGVAATVVMAGFVWRQATAATPLLPLRLFRSRQVSVANGVVVLVFAAAFGFQFTTALYLQRVLGFDPLQTGLAFLPTAVLIGAVSMGASARLTVRFGVRPVLPVGIAGFAVSLILVSRLGVGADYLSEVFPLFVLMGAATGLVIPALMLLAMSGADPDDAGVASGLVDTTQQAGAAVGLAVLATVASGAYERIARGRRRGPRGTPGRLQPGVPHRRGVPAGGAAGRRDPAPPTPAHALTDRVSRRSARPATHPAPRRAARPRPAGRSPAPARGCCRRR